MKTSSKIQDRYETIFFSYDKFKNTDFLQHEKTEKKHFLLILKSNSRN